MSEPATDTPADATDLVETAPPPVENPPAEVTDSVTAPPEPVEDKKAKGAKKDKDKAKAQASTELTVQEVDAFQAAAEALRKKLEAATDLGAASSNVTYALGLCESPLNYLRTVLKQQAAE